MGTALKTASPRVSAWRDRVALIARLLTKRLTQRFTKPLELGSIARAVSIVTLTSGVLGGGLVVGALGGCERAPSGEGLKEWSPADHDRAEEQGRASSGQQAQAPAEARGDGGGANGGAALVEVAWSQNCAVCHGVLGKGDGPNGPMVKAGDLTREDWQAGVTDADIAAIIKTGKGRMPKFDLPDPVVRGLVGRIRAVRGR